MWEDSFHLLLLHGADWTSYRWKTGGEVVSQRVVFQPTSEFGVAHVTCEGVLHPIFIGDTIHFFFRGTNGLIYECTRSGPDWKLFDISQINTEGMTVLRPAGSELSVVEQAGVIHIFFVGIDDRLRELYKAPMKKWRHVSMRRHVGGSVCALPKQTRPFACLDSDSCLHVFFLNDERRIGECYWKMRRSKWRVFDTSEYIPKHGAVDVIFDVVADEGPHLLFLSRDGTSQQSTYHHVFWAQNTWVSAYWGTREGVQAFDDPPGSPAPDASMIPSSSAPAGAPAPPPPPPPSTASSSTSNLKVAKVVTAAKPPLVVKIPMKDGNFRKKMSSYKPVRLVVVSDTHNFPERVGQLPPGDILVHCGDFTVYGKSAEISEFADWLDSQTQYKHKIVIAGNHETNPERAKKILSDHCVWLDDKVADVMGITFYGTTWGCDYSNLPSKGIDVLLTHKPPSGHGDVIYTGVSRGSESLAVSVRKMKPIVHAFGHNHEGFGATCDTHTVYLNAATCMGSAKSSARRGCIIVDIYPELKSKYGDIHLTSPEELSSEASAATESLVQLALDHLPT